jgi:hypothetical protein
MLLLRRAVRPPGLSAWRRPVPGGLCVPVGRPVPGGLCAPVGRPVYDNLLRARTLASYQRRPTIKQAGGQRAGWIRRGVTAFFVVSGILLWGTTLLEYAMLESLPEDLEELMKAEEKEEEKVSRFYGLEGMSKDRDVTDDEYFTALDERKLLLQALLKKMDAHPQMEALLGKQREVTYLANRDPYAQGGATTAADWQGSSRAERERGETSPWCPRFHIQGEKNHQMAVAHARFVDNGRTGELAPVSLKVEMLNGSGTVLDVEGPLPHGLKYMRFDV